MYLAIEYLIRKGLVREWLRVPCSLFVTEQGTLNKIAITINEEFRPSQFYCVKHWHIHACKKNQALPSFVEFRVSKTNIFTNQVVVIPTCRLMPYRPSPIPFDENHQNHPMMTEVYHYFYENYLESHRHNEDKLNWLWQEFINTYLPDLSIRRDYIPAYKSDAEIASDQRNLVAQHFAEIWQCWAKWFKYMLYLDGVPGELVFSGEYRKIQGRNLWTEKSPPLSSARSLLLS